MAKMGAEEDGMGGWGGSGGMDSRITSVETENVIIRSLGIMVGAYTD